MTDMKSESEYRDVLLYLRASGTSFSTNIYTEDLSPHLGERKHPEQSKIINKTISGFVGSIFSSLEEPLFVYAYKDNIADLGDFSQTGSPYLSIVSNKFKDVVMECGNVKSEFIPVCVCLTPSGKSYPSVGGGQVVEDEYWLWHDYNWVDLIDDSNSEWQRDSVGVSRLIYRNDLPGTPMQAIYNWGPASLIPLRKLCLRDINYDTNPFFRVVGIYDGPFISPSLIHALKQSGLLSAKSDVRIHPMLLDTLTHYYSKKNEQDQVMRRVYQSDLIVPDGPAPFADFTRQK